MHCLIAVVRIILVLSVVMCLGCAQRVADPDNICEIFRQHPEWCKILDRVRKKFGVPVAVEMAILYQESNFTNYSAIESKKLSLGDEERTATFWQRYFGKFYYSQNKMNFRLAANFMGWYLARLHKKLDIPFNEADTLYLVYGEGTLNYRLADYQFKQELVRTALMVAWRAREYQAQLPHCRAMLSKSR